MLSEKLVHEFIEEYIPGGRVENIHLLAGDASTRKYYRLTFKNNDFKHAILCADAPREKLEDYPFYQVYNFLSANKIRIPQVYHFNISIGMNLQEDMGDKTLLSLLSTIKNPDEEYEIYKTILDILIKIHSQDLTKQSGKVYTQLSFDVEKFMQEIEWTITHFLEKLLNVPSSSPEISRIRSAYQNICHELAAYPRAFAHRDFHSRNIMVKNDEFCIIDFQDARTGIPQYDLVSLLEDCYYSLNPHNVDKLKKYYQQNIPSNILRQNNEKEFDRLYDLMTLQRAFKAIGSFSYVNFSKQDSRYLKHIGFVMEKIKNILFKYDEFRELRENLFRIYYER